MANLTPIQRFSENMSEFIALNRELLTKTYEEGKTTIDPNIVNIVEEVLKVYNKDKMVNNFISYSEPYWGEINKRDQSFFSEHCAKVFRDLPKDYVDSFKVLFESKDDETNEFIVCDEDRTAIWEYLNCLIATCINHIHHSRGPTWQDGTKAYSINYRPDVKKLQAWAKIFNLTLEWPPKPS